MEDVRRRQGAVMRALKSRLRRSTQRDVADSAAVAGNPQAPAAPDARFASLIVTLNGLQAISKLHAHYINWLRANMSHVRLPTLFSEIFDLPITDTGDDLGSSAPPKSSTAGSCSTLASVGEFAQSAPKCAGTDNNVNSDSLASHAPAPDLSSGSAAADTTGDFAEDDKPLLARQPADCATSARSGKPLLGDHLTAICAADDFFNLNFAAAADDEEDASHVLDAANLTPTVDCLVDPTEKQLLV